ncbi:carbohydrate-binding module family 48 protein [Botryobasidium botryosum FD-172 SS1]|uniref:Carbohydrate-binding module family 48 protein n=1 Tax=Botryobasidium botryosum (strain FD-172 SS1) TaxID=930990 RepID=A0A067MSF9_BOTB1|nr:carbohydrate-binding module family 48 protein [Botryobasidium botryosum FD-172 SS1]
MTDLHDVVFTWPSSDPQSVILTGSFDKWSKSVRLSRSATGGFSGIVQLPYGQNTPYKYVVDGRWCTRYDRPSAFDNAGNLNNIYYPPKKPVAPVAPVEVPAPAPKKEEVLVPKPAEVIVVEVIDLSKDEPAALEVITPKEEAVILEVVEPEVEAAVPKEEEVVPEETASPEEDAVVPEVIAPSLDETPFPEEASVPQEVIAPVVEEMAVPEATVPVTEAAAPTEEADVPKVSIPITVVVEEPIIPEQAEPVIEEEVEVAPVAAESSEPSAEPPAAAAKPEPSPIMGTPVVESPEPISPAQGGDHPASIVVAIVDDALLELAPSESVQEPESAPVDDGPVESGPAEPVEEATKSEPAPLHIDTDAKSHVEVMTPPETPTIEQSAIPDMSDIDAEERSPILPAEDAPTLHETGPVEHVEEKAAAPAPAPAVDEPEIEDLPVSESVSPPSNVTAAQPIAVEPVPSEPASAVEKSPAASPAKVKSMFSYGGIGDVITKEVGQVGKVCAVSLSLLFIAMAWKGKFSGI